MNEDINIGAISEALNNKMDRDTLNASDTGNINMAGLGMPSDTYIDLTLNASGSTYTAPANGWVYLQKDNGDSNHYCQIRNETSKISAWAARYTGSTNNGCYLPVHKGDIYTVIYNATGATVYFRFIYAVGSESEAS